MQSQIFEENYKIVEKVAETRNSLVYRVKSRKDDKTVIAKILKTVYSSPSEIARFKQEYNIIRSIDLEGVVETYEIANYNGGLALILEDFDGESLKNVIKDKKISIELFLKIAIKLSDTVGNLHLKNIIHKDIKPHNILINRQNEKVKITDFGISTVLTHENEEIYNPDVIEGTIVYMSPEQTGRMNRVVDYRTDMYSLGITFYEILTGEVPFGYKDPMEIIHSHIARMPSPPIEKNSSIPKIVSEIVMKLLSKTAEERYQNSHGLMADLKECEKRLKAKGIIEEFELAQKDISIKFNIIQALVGREKEMDILMSTFERVARGKRELILVSGAPGIGKSALINEIQKPIVARRGYFISGKYEQLRKDVPYSSIIQAFQSLIRQILAESEERIKAWKDDLLEALGPNGKVITEVIPDVELIIGKQPEVTELAPEEAQNRFNLVLKSFTSVFASSKHPLVLFLDDLQWADSASIGLIKILITDYDINHFLIIGNYRDNEVDNAHPLMLTLEEIKKKNVAINSIVLQPLEIVSVNKLISGFLRCKEDISFELAKLIHKKTDGNPFFVNQFMKALYEENLIELDSTSGWGWDIEKIKKIQVTDNVIELMANKISRLNKDTQDILKICACIGNRFDLDILLNVVSKPVEDILSCLQGAINEELIYLTGDIYKFYHDRIQEAAYSLMSDDEKVKMHYRIGKLEYESTSEEDLQNRIYYIINHLNAGSPLIGRQEERDDLAGLNLIAAGKAKSSTAYHSALNYLKAGIDLLPKERWQANYNLTLTLYKERMEMECLVNNFNESENIFFNILEKNIKSDIEKIETYSLAIKLYTRWGKYDKAIKTGIDGLNILGYKKFTAKPTKLRLLKEVIRLKINYSRIKMEDILNLPILDDSRITIILELTSSLAISAGLIEPNLLSLIIFHNNNLYLKKGLQENACYNFAGVGLIFAKGLHDYKSAYRVTEIAFQLSEKFNSRLYRNRIYYVFGYFIQHWQKHIRNSIEYFRDVYKHALEEGDLMYSVLSVCSIIQYRIMSGDNLNEIFQEAKQYENFIIETKDKILEWAYKDSIWFFHKMTGVSESEDIMESSDYDEEKQANMIKKEKSMPSLFTHYFHRLMTRFFLCDYSECLNTIIPELEKIYEVQLPTIYTADLYYYYSLILSALYPEASSKEKRKYQKKLKKNRKKIKNWSDHCPENFLHKYLLLEAEIARIKNNESKAMELYRKAIGEARDNQYIQDEAIANELAARFYLEKGFDDIATFYITESSRLYNKWGASAKVSNLEKQYSNLIRNDRIRLSDSSSITTTGSTSVALDLSTVIKSAQALSSEIDLEKLLENIMNFSIENAGAQKGLLILENKGDKKLYIEAEGIIDSGGAQCIASLLQSIPVDESAELSPNIVNYVNRTGENLVLNNAHKEGMFSNDTYVIKNSSKSILCTPIKHKGSISGILYLENNLTTNAFTPERLELLKILSSQAAISIENARLVKEREKAAKLETEMQLAKKMQIGLLPKNPQIKGFEIVGYMETADEVGGDYYDIINGRDTDWVIIGDVSGHGFAAGQIMTMVQSSIQTKLRENPAIEPSTLLNIVNNPIKYNISNIGEDKYMTITALAFKKDGKVVFSGLHQDILIYRASTNNVEAIETDGLWLAMDLNRPIKDYEFFLNSNDVVLLYTDGITEAIDADNKMFSIERLSEIFKNSGKLSLDRIKNNILESLKDYTTYDDVTMVILKKE